MGKGFQAIQGRVAASTEGGAARLTPKRLNPLGLAMLAIPDEGVELSVDVPEVGALPVGTGEAFGIYPFGGSPPAFDLAPGTRHPQTLALHPTREESRDDRRGNRLGSGA